MKKAYRIKSGDGWLVRLGKDSQPLMSTDIKEAKIMLHGEADRMKRLVEAAGFMAEIEEIK